MTKENRPLKFAIFGTGFWSRYQLAGWQEIAGAECVAVYNRTIEKAERLAEEFKIPRVYEDPETLLAEEKLDFVDIITSVETHEVMTQLAASKGLPVICQKPMSTDLESAGRMVESCAAAGVAFYVNENFRWQAQIREFKRKLDEDPIGRPWRARVVYNSSFPVFENQPFLKELDQFILTDVGTHILDVVRFLFGEVQELACHTHKVHRDIQGEDAATLLLKMANGMTVSVELSYATRWADERFPQSYVFVEGEDSSLELGADYWIRLTRPEGVQSWQAKPPYYAWADARYEPVHSSIVACQQNLLEGLKGTGQAETTGQDNLKTLQLVYDAYRSAASGDIIRYPS